MSNTPVDSVFETGLEVYGGVNSINDLRHAFLLSPFAAAQQALEPRYSTYWWEDTDKFQEMFGPDVNPVEHGSYQARTVAIPMIEMQLAEADLLPVIDRRFAHHFVTHHVQHDDHEGLFAQQRGMTSDVPHRELTGDIKQRELQLWFTMHRDLFGEGIESERHFEYVRTFENGGESTRAVFWDISERIGYLLTGARAAFLAFDSDELTQEERARSSYMARRVVGRHYPLIEAMRGKIVYADIAVELADRAVRQVCNAYDISREELYASEAA